MPYTAAGPAPSDVRTAAASAANVTVDHSPTAPRLSPVPRQSNVTTRNRSSNRGRSPVHHRCELACPGSSNSSGPDPDTWVASGKPSGPEIMCGC